MTVPNENAASAVPKFDDSTDGGAAYWDRPT